MFVTDIYVPKMSTVTTNTNATGPQRAQVSGLVLKNLGSSTKSVTANISNELGLYEGSLTQARAPWWAMALISLLIFIIVAANLLVIAAFLFDSPRRHEPFAYFLLNLAISDFLLGCFGLPHTALYTYYGYLPVTYKHCTFWMLIDYSTTSETLLCIMIIAFSWITTLAGILPGLLYSRLYLGDQEGPYDCYWDIIEKPIWASSYYPVMFLEWIPTIIIVICYLVIILKISLIGRHRRTAPITPCLQGEEVHRRMDSRRIHDERQAFCLISLLVGALILSWSPWFVCEALSLYGGYYNEVYNNIASWMSYIMSAVNPFLFNIANDDMRKAIRKMLQHVRSLHGVGNSNLGVSSGVIRKS